LPPPLSNPPKPPGIGHRKQEWRWCLPEALEDGKKAETNPNPGPEGTELSVGYLPG